MRAAGRSLPSAVIEASTLMAGADGKEQHEYPADDALDEAEAAAQPQSGQYQRWRRRLDVVWLPGGVDIVWLRGRLRGPLACPH
jgi:hypothetical protein